MNAHQPAPKSTRKTAKSSATKVDKLAKGKTPASITKPAASKSDTSSQWESSGASSFTPARASGGESGSAYTMPSYADVGGGGE